MPSTEGAKIDRRESNESVGVGGRLELLCSARGHSPIKFTWAKNGAPLHSRKYPKFI